MWVALTILLMYPLVLVPNKFISANWQRLPFVRGSAIICVYFDRPSLMRFTNVNPHFMTYIAADSHSFDSSDLAVIFRQRLPFSMHRVQSCSSGQRSQLVNPSLASHQRARVPLLSWLQQWPGRYLPRLQRARVSASVLTPTIAGRYLPQLQPAHVPTSLMTPIMAGLYQSRLFVPTDDINFNPR